MTNYYDNWQERDYACQNCGWQGKGSEYAQGDIYTECFQICCPNCTREIGIIMFPTIEESKKHYEKLSSLDKAMISDIEKKREEFKARRLASHEQLPTIMDDEDIVLLWDIEDSQRGGDTLIRYGKEIIWREPAIYEGYERFIEIAHLLKKRYGDQLQDLVPSRSSRLYLYGDRINAPDKVEKARRRLSRYKSEMDNE